MGNGVAYLEGASGDGHSGSSIVAVAECSVEMD